MKKSAFLLLAAFLAISLLPSCEEDNDDPKDKEFIADDQSFSDFMNWVVEANNQGPDPALGAAHGGNDNTVTRTVYFKDGQDRKNGEFPTGTMIVKHSHNPDNSVNAFTAMAKRGNDFNSGGGDWEFFFLNEDGTIATDNSGAQLRGHDLGACLSCHSQASSNDFIFSK